MNPRTHCGRIGRLSRACIATGALLGALALTAAPATTNAAAADGTLDTTFNAGGAGANGMVHSVAFAADDKVYIAGEFTEYNGTAVGGIARLNTDGTLDTTFNAGGAGFVRGSGMGIWSISVDSDGDIYALGKFASYNGATTYNNTAVSLADGIVRLNSDGTLDSGFVPPKLESSNFPGQPASVSLVKKIGDLVFVAGSFDTYYEPATSGTSAWAKGLIALTTSGAVDATFGANARFSFSGSTSRPDEIVKVPDSTDFYMIGAFGGVNSTNANRVVRIKEDATVNTTYANSAAPNVGPNNSVTGIVVLPDGKLLLSGNFSSFNGVTTAKGLVRMNPDATLDSTFTPATAGMPASVMVMDANNRIYISGALGTSLGAGSGTILNRLTTDGTRDPNFDVTAQPDNYETEVAISPAGKVYIFGKFTKYGNTNVGRIARVNASAPQTEQPETPTPSTPDVDPGVVTPAPSTTAAPTPAAPTTVASGAPGQPTNVKVVLSGNRATVSWSAPTTGGAPTGYTATATPVGPSTSGVAAASVSAASTLSCSVSAPASSCTIAGLQAGQKYGFSVSATNATGGSPAAAVAEPVAVPVAKASKAESLPETGADQSMWLMLSLAATLMLAGAALRRTRLS